MNITTEKEVKEILTMPQDEFNKEILPIAQQLLRQHKNNSITATAMLGYSNVCKNRCLYCGMRAGSQVMRYRIEPDEAAASAQQACEMGFHRIFLISGEDPLYSFDKLVSMVEKVKSLGFYIALACGEYSKEQYLRLKEAGADEYVVKFEMSNQEVFNRLNPSTTFGKRMQAINAVKECGLKLASGNIVDYPGHTIEDMVNDILLMKELEISWAPVIPYLPAAGTPLAKEGPRGDIYLNQREIAVLRIMMPDIDITAQQPGEDMTHGLADDAGNLLAIQAGANMLFADLLPDARVRNFSVIDNRVSLSRSHIQKMADVCNMNINW